MLSAVVALLLMYLRPRCSLRRGLSLTSRRHAVSMSRSFDQPGTCVVPSGLLAVHKPVGFTSTGLVSRIRWLLSEGAGKALDKKKVKIKVGHGGTLDNMAEGVLVLGVGEGTKLLEHYLKGPKSYTADISLGSETDTLDTTGNVTESLSAAHVTHALIHTHMHAFRGNITQVPPMYSALKHKGDRLSDLARRGIEIERKARDMTVYELLLDEHCDLALPEFRLRVSSSGGFYVRSLIADLSRSMDTRGHMTALLRTKQGPFDISQALKQDDWTFDRLCAAIVECSSIAGLDGLKPAVVVPSAAVESS